MPALTNHPQFPQPSDQNVTIWRYLDLPKLIDLLENKKLWFSRLDMLGDPFEGSVNAKIIDTLSLDANDIQIPTAAKETLEGLGKEFFKSSLRIQRLTSYVSCWRFDDNESMAMWRVYGKSDYSVAVKTQYSLLRDLLPSNIANIYLGCVKYVNYPDTERIQHNMLYYATRKHVGFQFEREVRAVFLHGGNIKRIMDSSTFKESTITLPERIDLENGIGIDIDINSLVLEIVSNPVCPEWFVPVLENLCRKYGYENQIRRSTLDARTWNLL